MLQMLSFCSIELPWCKQLTDYCIIHVLTHGAIAAANPAHIGT